MCQETGRDLSQETVLKDAVSLEEVRDLFREAVADEPMPTLLKGFKLDFSGNRDFHKLFFSVRCGCGTAALLSVELAKSKSLSQTKDALPGLVEHLMSKVHQFNSMSCEMHQSMRTGGRLENLAQSGSADLGPEQWEKTGETQD